MATFIDKNVKFHGFSKSPVSADTTLGAAVNASGHTVTTSQVRADDIPWFINSFASDRASAITWIGKNATAARHNDIVFYGGKFAQGFDVPGCLIYKTKNAQGEAITPEWQDLVLSEQTHLCNENDKAVIAIHKNCEVAYVDGGNNAATNSNQNSIFVKRSDGTILDHFVASTDKIHAGIPSLGYNALVIVNGAAIDEGELDNNYIGNTFAGIIHFNTTRTATEPTDIKVTCYEYIGDKLDATIEAINREISSAVSGAVTSIKKDSSKGKAITVGGQQVSGVADTYYGAITIDVTTANGTAGTTYANSTALAEQGYVDEKIAGATDSIDELEKLVGTLPGDIESTTVVSYIGEAISDAKLSGNIADNTTASGLVSASQVATYVENNAKVTVVADNATEAPAESVTSIEIAGSGSNDITISTEKDAASNDNGAATITIGASLTKATVNDDGSFNKDQGSLAVSAASAEAIATKVASDNDAITSIKIEGTEGTLDISDKTVTIPLASSEAAGVTKLSTGIIEADDESTDATAATVSSVAKTRVAIEKQISAATLTGTSSNGITINQGTVSADGTVTSTTITVTPAEVSEGAITGGDEGKLVTATGAQSIASKAVTDATLAADTKIAEITDTEDEGKLVTASQVTTYVSENAKVSVSADNFVEAPAEAVTSIKVAGDATGADVTIATSKDTNAEDGSATITVSATLNKATVGTNGTFDTSEGNGDKVVSANSAKAIAEAAVNAIGVNGEWSNTVTHEKIGDQEAVTSTQSISVAIDLDSTDKKVTVNATDIASATALERLKSHVNALHTTPQFDVVVFSGETAMADFEAATKVANRIYLVQADGQSSTYIEYIAYTSGESIVVEKIGDTEIDLSNYVTKDDLEDLEEKLEANNSSVTPIFDHVPNTPAGEIRSIQYGNGVWIATSSVAPGIWRSTDNGKSWTPIATAADGSAINGCGIAYYWAAKGTWFVGGYATAQAGLYTSTDNGATWTKVTTAAGIENIAPACFAASDSLIVAGLLAGKGVITSTDGVTWSVAATTAINSTPVTAAAYANGTWYFGVRGTAAAGAGKGGVWSTTDPTTTDVQHVGTSTLGTEQDVDRLTYINDSLYACAKRTSDNKGSIYRLNTDGTTWTALTLNQPDGTTSQHYYAYDLVKAGDNNIYAALWSTNGSILKVNETKNELDFVSANFLFNLGYDGQIYALGCNEDTLITGSASGEGLFIASIPSTFASQTGLRAVEESLNAKIDTVADSVSSAITGLNATIKDAENAAITITQTNGKLESVSLSIGSNNAQGGNGVSLTQATNGEVTLSVNPGTVADDSTGFVTGAAVKAATDAATTEVTSTAGEDDVVVGKVTSASNTDGSTTYTVDAAPRVTLTAGQFGTTVKGVKGDKVILEDGSIIYVDWSRVESAENLFANCETIEYFCADLINLKDGDGMFNGCTSLATFCGNLGSLESGVDMFSGCILDIDSAVYIVDSLPDYEDGSTHSITIGLSEGAASAEELASLSAESTGWTIA